MPAIRTLAVRGPVALSAVACCALVAVAARSHRAAHVVTWEHRGAAARPVNIRHWTGRDVDHAAYALARLTVTRMVETNGAPPEPPPRLVDVTLTAHRGLLTFNSRGRAWFAGQVFR